MKKKYKSLFKNIGIFTIGSFGSKMVSFFLVPLYTSVLSTEDYGMVELMSTTVQLITPILMLSVYEAVLRFCLDPDYRRGDVLSTSISIFYISSIILAVILLFLSIFKVFEISEVYYVFLFSTYFLGGLINSFGLYLKANDDAKTFAISGVICTLVVCLCNIAFLLYFNMGVLGYMLGSIIGLLVQCVYMLFAGKIYKDIHIKKYNNISKPMLKYSIPLISNSIAWWVNNASDRYILSWFIGVDANGIYAVSYKVPTILTTFQGIFYNAWSVSAISEFDKEDSDGFIGRNYTMYSFLSIAVCSFLIIANIPIAKLLFAKDFYEAWKYVPFLLVGTILNGLSQFEGTIFAAVKMTKEVSKTTITGAVTNIVLNVILISTIGVVGAAIATLVGYLVMWILRTIKVQRIIKMRVDWLKNIVSISLVIIQSVLATFGISIVFQIVLFCLIVLLYFSQIKMLIVKTLGKLNK